MCVCQGQRGVMVERQVAGQQVVLGSFTCRQRINTAFTFDVADTGVSLSLWTEPG